MMRIGSDRIGSDRIGAVPCARFGAAVRDHGAHAGAFDHFVARRANARGAVRCGMRRAMNDGHDGNKGGAACRPNGLAAGSGMRRMSCGAATMRAREVMKKGRAIRALCRARPRLYAFAGAALDDLVIRTFRGWCSRARGCEGGNVCVAIAARGARSTVIRAGAIGCRPGPVGAPISRLAARRALLPSNGAGSSAVRCCADRKPARAPVYRHLPST